MSYKKNACSNKHRNERESNIEMKRNNSLIFELYYFAQD